jgi:hypothetical protein
MMKKRLIALMISATLVSSALTGCSNSPVDYEQEIAMLLEKDSGVSISAKDVSDFGLKVDFKSQNGKFFISFATTTIKTSGKGYEVFDNVAVTYEVDKLTFEDFKNNYNLDEQEEDLKRVENLTQNFNPINVETKQI